MHLRVTVGLEEAKRELRRADPLGLGALPTEVAERTEALFGQRLSAQESVQRIVDDVRQGGDAKVRHYSRLLDGAEAEALEVSPEQIRAAAEEAPADLMEAADRHADSSSNQ